MGFEHTMLTGFETSHYPSKRSFTMKTKAMALALLLSLMGCTESSEESKSEVKKRWKKRAKRQQTPMTAQKKELQILGLKPKTRALKLTKKVKKWLLMPLMTAKRRLQTHMKMARKWPLTHTTQQLRKQANLKTPQRRKLMKLA